MLGVQRNQNCVIPDRVVVQFESSHLTIAMEAWKPASLKAMPPQSNTL
jgi:hypothetical protein